MNNPLVSVIIPNYCHAKYLDQRIQSVLNQTYQNFEIIILDDASPDNGASKNVIEKYRDNPHISHIVYNEVNSGSTFRQWHKGFELAKGEYIWIAESDDYCEHNFLETLIVPFLEHKEVVLTYCDLLHVDNNGKEVIEKRDNAHNIPSTKNIYNGIDFIKERMTRYNSIWNASSVLFKKSIVFNISDQYTNFKGAGDYLFWIEILEKGSAVKIDKTLDYFRLHGNNITPANRINGTLFKEEVQILNYIRKKHIIKFSTWLHYYVNKYDEIFINMEYDTEVKKHLDRWMDPFNIFNKITMPLIHKILNY